ncbi:hypothetical protein [Thermosulfurimonas sp. F29]|uniref:hypothetical protein n=1 Tax=Thermosulfurimonas sp. F29 TaxID=2867247 RepID=UPI001C83468F|nr:hypothetical protein [Thermosulfurimonas sp. F29]MBX6423348.1 hypothetical protein [Thermosulfurimonas sp. F29]
MKRILAIIPVIIPVIVWTVFLGLAAVVRAADSGGYARDRLPSGRSWADLPRVVRSAVFTVSAVPWSGTLPIAHADVRVYRDWDAFVSATGHSDGSPYFVDSGLNRPARIYVYCGERVSRDRVRVEAAVAKVTTAYSLKGSEAWAEATSSPSSYYEWAVWGYYCVSGADYQTYCYGSVPATDEWEGFLNGAASADHLKIAVMVSCR